MRCYTIIGGVNGVGKSSLTGVLTTQLKDLGRIFNVDKFAVETKCSTINAGRIAISNMNDYIERGLSFSQETTLVGHRTEAIVKKAIEKGYTIRLFYVGLNTPEESIKRIQNRVQKGGHNIKDDDVIRRFNSRFDTLINILPWCGEVSLWDNENGFVEVAEYQNGEIVFKRNYQPKWLDELRNVIKMADF